MKRQQRCSSCLFIQQKHHCNFIIYDATQICPCYDCLVLSACKEYCDIFLHISLELYYEAANKNLNIARFEQRYGVNSLR
jgi:hypothetical protein